jgi:hypothetical protein
MLKWIEELLNLTDVPVENKNSIYHRFANTDMAITGKLIEQNVFYTILNLKFLLLLFFHML